MYKHQRGIKFSKWAYGDNNAVRNKATVPQLESRVFFFRSWVVRRFDLVYLLSRRVPLTSGARRGESDVLSKG